MISLLSANARFQIAALIISIILLFSTVSVADETRTFPVPQGLITDLTGILTTEQITGIESAIASVNEQTGLDGRVVVVQKTDDWYLEEYTKDYGDWLQSQRIISNLGWVIYISTEDRKFGIAVQDGAIGSFSANRQREIRLILSENLDRGDLNGAITNSLQSIGELPQVRVVSPAKKSSTNTILFVGIAVVLFTLMLRQRKLAKPEK
jgi:uncharacterized membrane protein YgcG